MNGNYLLLFFIVVAIVSFVVWRSKQAKRASDARHASETAAQTRSDQAFAIGVATGTMGGSVKDAAVVRFALDRAKKDGHQPDARDIGFALGMEKEISQSPPDQT